MNHSRKTEIEYRDTAMQVLEKMKRREQDIGMIPIKVSPVNRTIIMVPAKLSLEEKHARIQRRFAGNSGTTPS